MDKILFESINSIVLDTLATRNPLYIDTIGSLVPTAENATIQIKGSQHTFLRYKIMLHPDKVGTDLRAQILVLKEVDKKNLKEIFNEWLALSELYANNTNDFQINGVVTSVGGKISSSEELDNYLNPPYTGKVQTHSILSAEKSRILVISIVIALLAITGITIYSHMSGRGSFIAWLVSSPNSSAVSVEEIIVAKPADSSKVADTQGVQEKVKAASVEAFYIIVGSFSERSNAEKLNAKLKEKQKKSEVLYFGNNHYVTIDKFDTRIEATKAINGIYYYTDYWVLQIKDNKIIKQ